MNDRFMNGLVAGTVAGFIQGAVNSFMIFILHFGHLRFADFSGIIIYGTKPKGLSEFIFAGIAQLGYAGSVGIAFSFLLKYISKNYLWVKGIYFGLAMWFFAYAITLLYKVPGLVLIPFESAACNFISSVVYGLTLAWAINKLERLEKIQ